jgi:Type IV secretion system proteins
MRRFLLAAGCFTLPLLPHSVRAQASVLCVNCTDETTTVLNDATVLAQWATQLARMTQQIQQQIAIFQQLSGLTNVNQIATVLNQAGNFNAMNSYGNVSQMLQGSSFGNLGATGQGYLTQNTYFMPTPGSPMPLLNAVSTLFNQRAGSLASMQAISSSLMGTSNTILTGLRTLQQQIDAQPSAQTMAGINARLSAYQGNISSQQYQLAQAQAFANAQRQVFDQQEQQAAFCSAYSYFNDTRSFSGAGLTLAGNGARCTGGAGANAQIAAGSVSAPAAGVTGLGAPGNAVPTAAAPIIDRGAFDTPVNEPTPATAAPSPAAATAAAVNTDAFDTPL